MTDLSPTSSSTLKTPLGIYGGTFDPVHWGHLSPLIEVQQTLNLPEILLLPCHIPPHKSAPNTSSEHRLNMLRLASQSIKGLTIDDRELKANTISYTVNTLKQFREEKPNTPFCFMIGMDSLNEFTTWYQWQSILSLTHLVVMQRGNTPLDHDGSAAKLMKDYGVHTLAELKQSLAGKIYVVQTNEYAISSSDIRKRVAAKKSIDALVPEAVVHYIHQHGLYL